MQRYRTPSRPRVASRDDHSCARSIAALLALGLILTAIPGRATVTNTWTATTSVGFWTDGANWATESIPMVAGDVANLSATTAARTNIVNSAVVVGTVKMGGAYNFVLQVSGNTLTFNSGSAEKAWLQQLAGNGRCNVNSMVLASDLDVVNSNSQYFDLNGISGAYDIHVNRTTGTGTPYVGGNNANFTGNWHVYAGRLMWTGDPFGNTTTGTRLITLYNNATLRDNGNSLSANRRIVIGPGGGTLALNGKTLSLNGANQLAGSELLSFATETGTLGLHAANDSFTGPLVVGNTSSITNTLVLGSLGTINNAPLILLANVRAVLDVTGKPSGYSIPAGQVVAGIGTVRGKVNASTAGGKIHPGSYTLPGPTLTPGTLTITNGLAMANGGAYLWTLKSLKDNANGVAGTDFGKLAVTAGPVSLSGGVLTLAFTSAASGVGHPDNGNVFWKGEHAWTILTAEAPPSGILTVSNGSYTDGVFKTEVSGNALLLVYGRPVRATAVIVR